MTKGKNNSKKLVLLAGVAVILLFLGLGYYYLGTPIVNAVQNPEAFRTWVRGYGVLGKLIFIGMMALQIIVAVIPGEPLEITAGYAFGSIEGMFLCLIGAVVGSTVIYLFVKYLGVKFVHIFFSQEQIDSLKFLQNEKKFHSTVFMIFLIPGTPKDLISYFIGLTKMKLSTWLLITFFARIPSVITSTVGGDALGLKNYTFAVVVFAVTIVISLLGIYIYNKKVGANRGKEQLKNPCSVKSEPNGAIERE